MHSTDQQLTRLIQAIDRGEPQAAEELLPLVYEELRSRAGALMALERRDHTLQRTALVHEAFLRLVGAGSGFHTRRHFFNAAALAMRRILIDHADQKKSLKRGGGKARLELDDVDLPAEASEDLDWVELDAALKDLASVSARQHQVVMLRFFSGRTEAEIAEMLELSESTVHRDWLMARAWLYRAMRQKK